MLPFVHLHAHSEYSLLDGASRIPEMVRWAKEKGMPALALTDHGVLYGAIEFYKEAKKAGIKPILGCEVYVAPGNRTDKTPADRDKENAYHLVLLAETQEGWNNLIRLVSMGHLEGFYYKPRVDKELLKKYHKGIIALSACLAGEIPALFMRGDEDAARKAAEEYREIFGPDHFFLEVQDQGIEIEKSVNQFVFKLADELSIPVVATNDSHYVSQDHAERQDVLMCIQMQKNVDDPGRLKFPTSEFYLKDGQEMSALFPGRMDIIENTVKIAERCNVELKFGEYLLPDFEVPLGETSTSYLRALCEVALQKKYPEFGELEQNRLNHELQTIGEMGFSSYFLIVWDFVRFARESKIAVGPGRGSAAGSIVAYLLGITNLDPIEHQLLFERFLNPERITMPDIDIDFCYERRGEVLQYVVDKYGTDRVAQIITFGTLAARAAVRDVGRALGIPYGDVDRIAKLIPRELGITLEKALLQSKELQEIYNQDSQIKNLIDLAKGIEGMPRNASTHAAGVVIGPDELQKYVPLQNSSEGFVTTQWDKDRIEELGLLKMDLLGLTTLTIIEHALDFIEESTGERIDMDHIPSQDPKVAEMLRQGKTAGVFQLESGGMTELIRQIAPKNFEEIIPVVALFRPGPLGSGMVEDFIERKHGRKAIEYAHPDLAPVLEETFGVILYQEQVMKIASLMGGFSLGEADLLRRAMSKKKADVLAAQKERFIAGAIERNYGKELAEKTFDLIAHFADYGFNKSHSAPYAWIAYQTAWLKANYPAQFMAALLSNAAKSSDKMTHYIETARQMGLKILPPDVNISTTAFGVDENGCIRFGMGAIKNIGDAAIRSILTSRKSEQFKSLSDFCNRVDARVVNKRVLENLIKAGALDSLGLRRSQMLAILEPTLDAALSKQKSVSEGLMDLFDMGSEEDKVVINEISVPDLPEVSPEELLAWEKELTGFYVSSHPLHGFMETLENLNSISELQDKGQDSQWCGVGGVVIASRRITTQKGDMMCFATLEDTGGVVEVILFPKVFDRYGKYILPDGKVQVFGKLQVEEEQGIKLIAQQVIPLDVTHIVLNLDIRKRHEDDASMARLKMFLQKSPGKTPILLRLVDQKKVIRTFEDFWVTPSRELIKNLNELLGEQAIHFTKE